MKFSTQVGRDTAPWSSCGIWKAPINIEIKQTNNSAANITRCLCLSETGNQQPGFQRAVFRNKIPCALQHRALFLLSKEKCSPRTPQAKPRTSFMLNFQQAKTWRQAIKQQPDQRQILRREAHLQPTTPSQTEGIILWFQTHLFNMPYKTASGSGPWPVHPAAPPL